MSTENNVNIEAIEDILTKDISKEIINEKYDIKIKEKALENRKRLKACIQKIRSLNTKLEALFPTKSNHSLNEFLEYKK